MVKFFEVDDFSDGLFDVAQGFFFEVFDGEVLSLVIFSA